MSTRLGITAILVVWILGAFLFPLNGMIHFLLITALIVAIIDSVGRAE